MKRRHMLNVEPLRNKLFLSRCNLRSLRVGKTLFLSRVFGVFGSPDCDSLNVDNLGVPPAPCFQLIWTFLQNHLSKKKLTSFWDSVGKHESFDAKFVKFERFKKSDFHCAFCPMTAALRAERQVCFADHSFWMP
jgi:hypothetical protein